MAAITYFMGMYVLDTFSISRVLGRFGYGSPVKELLPARGATYLFMVLNYAAGQAAFAFYQNRKHNVPISKMLGIFGIIVVVDLYILMTLAFTTTFFTDWPYEIGGMKIAHFVRIFTLCAYAGFSTLLVLRRIHARFGVVEKLRRYKLIDLIMNTDLSDYANIFLVRLPVHVFIICGMYLAIVACGLSVPFLKVLANIPLVFFIGSLPITPGGLGTGNAAMVELFKPFVSSPLIESGAASAGDLIFSFSLIWLFANYLMKALIGIVCLKFVSKDLFKPTEGTPEEEAEDEASHLGGNL